MSVREVVLKVQNGIVDPISIPEGITVIVRDYDVCCDVDDDVLCTDNDDVQYVGIVFDHEDSICDNTQIYNDNQLTLKFDE